MLQQKENIVNPKIIARCARNPMKLTHITIE
jgi:hypothetical protein